jgi:hypothetical protein
MYDHHSRDCPATAYTRSSYVRVHLQPFLIGERLPHTRDDRDERGFDVLPQHLEIDLHPDVREYVRSGTRDGAIVSSIPTVDVLSNDMLHPPVHQCRVWSCW